MEIAVGDIGLEHLAEDDSKRVQVSQGGVADIVVLRAEDFRGNIADGTTDRDLGLAALAGAVDGHGETEIDDDNVLLGMGDHQVGGVDVEVDNILGVDGSETCEDLLHSLAD